MKIAAVIAAFGTLFSLAGYQQHSAPQLELALIDLNGNRTNLGPVPTATFAPRISPSGRQVTFDTPDQEPAVWIADFPSLKSMRRFPGLALYPMWSADGAHIFFIGLNMRQQALFRRRADGTAAELLTDSARAPEHWLAKMQSITFITLNDGDYDVWRYSFVEKKASPFVQIPKSSQHSSNISPDERWIAYVSDETGRFEVYVQPIPLTGAKIQLTKDGGEHPLWSPDGRALYYNRGRQLFSIKIEDGEPMTAGASTPLPIKGFVQGLGRRQFDISGDGKQFLMLFPR